MSIVNVTETSKHTLAIDTNLFSGFNKISRKIGGNSQVEFGDFAVSRTITLAPTNTSSVNLEVYGVIVIPSGPITLALGTNAPIAVNKLFVYYGDVKGLTFLNNGVDTVTVSFAYVASPLSVLYAHLAAGMSAGLPLMYSLTSTVYPVQQAPITSMTYSVASGNAPLTVAFTASALNIPTSWAWTFGDGGVSTLQNPSHTYTIAGSYTATVTASNSAGSGSASHGITVANVVPVPVPVPVASFNYTPTTGFTPLSVTFTDTSTNSPTSWSWDFGDGGLSTQQNPIYDFQDGGSYTVTLRSSNSGGQSAAVTHTVNPVDRVVSFTGAPTSGTAPYAVTFSDTSNFPTTEWYWTFGDGGVSTQQNPTHAYTVPGNYDVVLSAGDGQGNSESAFKPGYVAVSAPAIAHAKSLRLRRESNVSISRTPASAGNRQKWTFAAWVKRSSLGTYNGLFGGIEGQDDWFDFRFDSNNKLTVDYAVGGAGSRIAQSTTLSFTDVSQWYYIVLAVDTTQATPANRIVLYVNGTQLGLDTYVIGSGYIAQNANTVINAASSQRIGARDSNDMYMDGYLSSVFFIDGYAGIPTTCATYNVADNVWLPASTLSGAAYGANGYNLTFSDSTSLATLGQDTSGNGNNFSIIGISLTAGAGYDVVTDWPSGASSSDPLYGNYLTAESLGYPLEGESNAVQMALTRGNLTVSTSPAALGSATSAWAWMTRARVTTGLVYWEITYDNLDITTNMYGGSITMMLTTDDVLTDSLSLSAAYTGANPSGNYSWLAYDNGNLAGTGATPRPWATGDTLRCAYDLGSGNFWAGDALGWFTGNPATLSTPLANLHNVAGQTRMLFTGRSGAASNVVSVNLGQRPFTYVPPAGYKTWRNANPAP